MFSKLKLAVNLSIMVMVIITLVPSNLAQAMQSAESAGYSISGRVTDGSGNGMDGVTVYATPNFWMVFLPMISRPGVGGSSANFPPIQSSTSPTPYTTLTDAAGNYTFASLRKGTYTLSAAKDGIVFDPASRIATLPGSNSQEFQVQILPPVIPPTTEVISPETNQNLQSITPDGSEFTFSQTTPELQSLSAGDLIVSDVTTVAPSGYLRKVTSVTNQAGSVVVDTEPAVLEETVQDGSVYFSDTLSPAEVNKTTALPGVRMASPVITSPTTFSFEVNDVVLYDDDNNLSTTNDQVKANGTIEFEMDYEFYLNIQGSVLRNLTFASRNTVRDTLVHLGGNSE